MDWQIVIAIGVGITAFAGLGGMYYAHLNQQNSTIYNLPVLHSEVSRPEDGMRWVTFSLEILPGRPDWNVVGARINRNWRRRRLLAEGVYTPSEERDPYGIAVDFQYRPDGPWQRRLVHRLRTAREELGWTRREVGERAGVDLNMIYEYESGRRNPSTLALRGLAALYGKSVEWFYGEGNDDSGGSSIEADRELVMNEASLALRSTGKELSDEAIRSIADFIRFVHEKERRESQSGS